MKRAQHTCVNASHPVVVADSAVKEVESLAAPLKVASSAHAGLIVQNKVSDSGRVPYQVRRVDFECIHNEQMD